MWRSVLTYTHTRNGGKAVEECLVRRSMNLNITACKQVWNALNPAILLVRERRELELESVSSNVCLWFNIEKCF